ncbi:MAG: PqqD family protein [Theionarchaea archaeon]|nr:PqqD family protein [Theionarchaea archaeon]
MAIEMKDVFKHQPDIETKRTPALQRDLNIRYREEEEGILLINQVDRNVYRLNRTAGEIFLMCDGINATQDIINKITEKYEGDPQHIKDAVINVLEDLIQRGMVQIVDKPGEPEDTAFLHREGTSDSYKLNRTMTFIWKNIDGVKPIEQIINETRDTYEIPHETAEKAVLNAVAYFVSENLVLQVNT